jgi:leader peptidase (prepilin peptidase)/N-methyltransferase
VFLIYRIIFLDLAIFLEGLVGFVLCLVILLISYFVKRDSIGIGDIAAISTCGMIIGFPNIFHFLFKAFLFVFLYGIFLIITKKKNKIDEIPLAPFLLIATII